MGRPKYSDAVARHMLAVRQEKAEAEAKAERLRQAELALLEAAEAVDGYEWEHGFPLDGELLGVIGGVIDAVRNLKAVRGE
jgi:hypothetical protein